jgi:hypothetical protein
VGARLVTAVALYGAKGGPLKALLETVQGLLTGQLGAGFVPYTLDQIHGTVIRLDGMTDARAGGIVNQRYADVTGSPGVMDHALAWRILAAHLTPPLRIRIGGFLPHAPAPFTSRGQHPYARAFALSGTAFVLMGWPEITIASGMPRAPLDDLRRAMSEANILHWYHNAPGDIDNDFHLVVGHYDGAVRPGAARPGAARADASPAVDAVRSYLARRPVLLEVGVAQLSVIAADSPTLAQARFIGRVPLDPADVARLYR